MARLCDSTIEIVVVIVASQYMTTAKTLLDIKLEFQLYLQQMPVSNHTDTIFSVL